MLGTIAMLSACNKSYLEDPDFTVNTNNLIYKVGDSVKFMLKGDASYISFFSGELGKEYTKKEVYTNDKNGNAILSFNSNVQFGTTTINNLSVLVSNNFNGTYDTTNVKNATWTDITNQASLGTSATNVASGAISLTPYQAEGKPIYIAFKYLANSAATLKQRQWTVGAFNLLTTHADGEVYPNATSFTDGVFKNVEFNGDSARWVINTTSVVHTGLNAGYPADNDWVISKGFDLRAAVGDAAGVAIVKNITTGFVPRSYSYIYKTPGTYKATFIARNASIKGAKDKIIEINITITP